MFFDDTIVAPALPMNVACAIGIIRISGKLSAAIFAGVMAGPDGGPLAARPEPRRMYHGYLVDCVRPSGAGDPSEPRAGERTFVDEVMACFYKGPSSFTGEDMLEIFCHGGAYNMKRIVSSVLNSGARYAEPGEFTRRACVNGKMDLCRAEAILDVVASRTKLFHDNAVSQIKGSLSFEIGRLRDELLDLVAGIEASIDFPEDDVGPAEAAAIADRLSEAGEKIVSLLATYEYGRIIRNGIRLVITGSPNVGKSSLFNLLLRENRAIVTEIPGTTRDVLEETVNIGGIPFSIVDTAGLRDAGSLTGDSGAIEKIGIERARAELGSADLALVVLDASRALGEGDVEILRSTAQSARVVVVNKIDARLPEFSLEGRLAPGEREVNISVRENINVCDLTSAVIDKCGALGIHDIKSGDVIVTNARHADALGRAGAAIRDALATLAGSAPLDLATIDIRAALSALGEIVGETLTEDVLNKIFEKFCLGK